MSLTGIPIEPLTPGSPAWLSKMSASKVAAVLGLSPYDSRFSLWHRMNGTVEHDLDGATPELRRGHYLEPAIAAWFADQHPDATILAGGCWQHPDADWYTASPDRLMVTGAGDDREYAGVEAKTEADSDKWGDADTDQVPVEVRAQVMSQMDVCGTRRTYVAVLLPYLEFRSYVIDFDQTEADYIRGQCTEFMDTLARGERPNLDDHAATYQTLRALHPDIDGADVELDYPLVIDYCTAKHALKAAKADDQRVTNLMADAIGTARRGRFLDQTIATRQAKAGTPYLVVGRSLPTFDVNDAIDLQESNA